MIQSVMESDVLDQVARVTEELQLLDQFEKLLVASEVSYHILLYAFELSCEGSYADGLSCRDGGNLSGAAYLHHDPAGIPRLPGGFAAKLPTPRD